MTEVVKEDADNLLNETKDILKENKETLSENKEIKTENNASSETDPNNVYAYLNRSDFTSEKFKLEINGLPKFYGISELKRLIKDKLKLDCNKVKTPRKGSHFAYVCFRSEEDKQNGLKILNGYQWKGKVLSAIEATAAPDPLVKKRKEFQSGENSKRFKIEGTQKERLQSTTIPYAEFSYDKQLEMKQSDIHQVLLKLGNELWKHNQVLRPWIEKQREKYNGLPCELMNIRSAKKYNEYRNKCEFTVGMDHETKLPTVGFRLGAYVDGFTGVAPIDDLIHIPKRIKVAVKTFENFVRNYTQLRIFNPEFQSGEFRQLTTRWSTTTDELMLIIGIQTKEIDEDTVNKLKKDLIEWFTNGDGSEAKLTSLFIKVIQKRNAGEPIPTPEHLYGTTYIQEKLLDLTFRISPDAFFQVNTDAAEVLYSSAIEIAKPTNETSIVDICCGTGTIGLCFSKHCGQVLGLEIVADAVVDAKANADINNIKNAEFYQGKAEEILLSVIRKAQFDDVIAVVDPPRAGLHQKAVIQLRQTTKLKKLLYISCDSNAALKNFVDMGRPPSKTLHNEPFVPIKAVTVDLFPHTKHCELLIYFERFTVSMLEELHAKAIEANENGKLPSKNIEVSENVEVSNEKLVTENVDQ
ncbi:tRNA (uracil-5-)-methyltransferase homolog A [Chrysoperla carnea]|uniref:tRNA (uracil-5-)-methyltransferase homolog A n=1 Tax=Chrysoperla carnea TaxID=189513 RepID=UPI001D08D36D|nr:tRNA (uracil-5-)-methyltransferase homolog A [Chrysoperla carnea]